MRVDLHPVYLVSIGLESLFNVDLSTRGYYQVRISLKPSNIFSSVDLRCLDKNSNGNSVLPFTVHNGVAISRTVELSYIEECLHLGDVFHIKVQLLPLTSPKDFLKRNRLHVTLELWSMDRHRPPRHDLFEMDSSRTIEIDLNPTRLSAIARPICFDYRAPSVLTISVFVSLVSIMPRRRKSPPDPKLSKGLRDYYKEMTNTLLKSMNSIKTFISNNSKFVNTVVNFEKSETALEEATLLARLESSDSPWVILESTAVDLSTRLDVIFRQMLDLFSRSTVLLDELSYQYFEWRLRLLGEAFFFTERPLHLLKTLLPYNCSDLYSQLIKGKYLQQIARYPVSCPSTDSPADLCPIIFEECYETNTTSAATCKNSHLGDEQKPTESTQLKRGGVSKSLRLLKFRRKSDAQNNKKLVMSRWSVDECSNVISGTPGKSDSNQGDHGSSSSTSCTPQPESSVTGDCFTPTNNIMETGDSEQLEKLVEFVKEREHVKQKLLDNNGYDGFLYSELASPSFKPAQLPPKNPNRKRLRLEAPAHLIVLVHGLEGSSEDLIPYKNALRISSPETNFFFLMSSSNHRHTWADFESLSKNLLNEIRDFLSEMPQSPERISFIAHSMGGVIVRALLGLSEAAWLFPKLYTFLSINSPHLGLAYAGRSVNWGVQLVQWWKGSKSMEQLALRDAVSFNDSYIVRLSANKAFGRFKYILLIGGPNDLFVPCHSALIDQCKTSSKDVSALGSAYREMLENIHGDILSSNVTETVAKFSTFHNSISSRTSKISGRAAHLAAVEDDVFIEKFLSISALRYFV